MNTRLEVILTPDLSLQFFGQPLISANDFTTYKQLPRPASFEFLRFEEGSPRVESGKVVACDGGRIWVHDGIQFVDFVWRQDRADVAPLGDPDFGRDLGTLFDARSRDRFILKIQHFLSF